MRIDGPAARAALGFGEGETIVALLPGSRRSEVSRLSVPYLETVRWIQAHRPELKFAVALANADVAELFAREAAKRPLDEPPVLIQGRAREVMAAAEVVLTASGTAALEAMLLKRRMVVAHKISPLTYWIVRRMGVARLANYSLPNLLSGRSLVPEFVQNQVRPDILGPAVLDVLDDRRIHADWYDLFMLIHQSLRRDASAMAAAAVLELIHSASARA